MVLNVMRIFKDKEGKWLSFSCWGWEKLWRSQYSDTSANEDNSFRNHIC